MASTMTQYQNDGFFLHPDCDASPFTLVPEISTSNPHAALRHQQQFFQQQQLGWFGPPYPHRSPAQQQNVQQVQQQWNEEVHPCWYSDPAAAAAVAASAMQHQVGSSAIGCSFPFHNNIQQYNCCLPSHLNRHHSIPQHWTNITAPSFQPATSHLVPLSRRTCQLQSAGQPSSSSFSARGRPNMSLHNDAGEEDELAQMQRLSNAYEPEVNGPFVGPRIPSTAITAEYLSAGPVLQAKTAALPQKYSHYRTMRGDGRCGWRAIAFGYFEALIAFGNPAKCIEEEARLRSLNNILNAAGFNEDLYEDFAEEVYTLLRSLSEQLQHGGNSQTTIEEAFNDESTQNYIVTYLKTLTAAWMKTHEDEYAPWLYNTTVPVYCDLQVMPLTSEIEDVSLNALRTVFLSPAKIALEVVYLDQSKADEVNTLQFDPSEDVIGNIILLYRPGHYDIIYRAPANAAPVVAYLQFSSQTHLEPIADLGMSDFMTAIPGMSYANPQSFPSGYGHVFPMPTATQRTLSMDSISSISPPTPNESSFAECQSTSGMSRSPHTTRHSAKQPATDRAMQTGSSPFRKSAWELEPEFATSQVSFKTAVMLNSPYNTAHFLNPDFQPDQWQPDNEYVVNSQPGKSSGRNLRHRFNA